VEVADRDFEVFDRSIDVHVSSLRKKLGDDANNTRFNRNRSFGWLPDEKPAAADSE
jgi:DNA-binding response OmpR family regulator